MMLMAVDVLMPTGILLLVFCLFSTDFLHELLAQVFSAPVRPQDNPSETMPDLAAILDDSSVSQDVDFEDPDYDVKVKSWQLRHAILIARQLSVEDERITGFSYQQWWIAKFSTSPFQSKGGVIASRRGVAFLATHLLSLLPHEHTATFLRTQISSVPFWAQRSEDGTSEEEGWLDLWRDYADIGKGRLAELRNPSTEGLMAPPGLETASDERWTEVKPLVEEFADQLSRGVQKDSAKVPSAIVEIGLFRPQYLREVVMPLLRSPPPLTDPQREACALLVRLLESRFCFKSTKAINRPAKRNVRNTPVAKYRKNVK
ncbi:unnamed protein product [Mesocestoides corti]|uniref:Uncharacterized protein n=1 Tax=Mesocestoides corti TaxID=53468 RepID=A0A3P6H0R5_MESCO|nr:unnamed protein product [Mesocestoides corti]